MQCLLGFLWQVPAALNQPSTSLHSLSAEADALWRQHRERQHLQREHVTAAASRPRPKAAAAQASIPAAEPARTTPALRGEEAAAGGSSGGGGSKRPRKEKGERRRQHTAAAAEAAAAVEHGRSGQAEAPTCAAELQQQPATKKKRQRQKEKGSSSTPAGLGAPPSAAVPRQAAPAAAPAAQGHQPPAKKRRREAGSSKPAAAGTDAAPHAAEAAAQEQQSPPCDPYSGAFAAFRPQAAAAEGQQQGFQPAERPPASGTQRGAFSVAFAAFAPAPAPAAVALAAAAPAAAAPVAAAVARTRPPAANRRWRPEADAELQHLAGSAEHRQRVLGSAELDWETIGRHFGRSASAVQDHYCRLRRAASGVQPAAGSAIAAGSKRTAPSEEAGRLVGSGSTAAAAAQPVRAAITIGLPPPAAQQHESPPFVGAHPVASSRLPWASHAMIQSKLWHLASCASRAAAAAAHDVTRIWCSLHGKGGWM